MESNVVVALWMTSWCPSASLCYPGLLKGKVEVLCPSIPTQAAAKPNHICRSGELPVPSHCWLLYVLDGCVRPRQPSAAGSGRYQPALCSRLTLFNVSWFMSEASFVTGLKLSCLNAACIETSPWGPKLSQRFSPRPSQRCRVLLNTHLAN